MPTCMSKNYIYNLYSSSITAPPTHLSPGSAPYPNPAKPIPSSSSLPSRIPADGLGIWRLPTYTFHIWVMKQLIGWSARLHLHCPCYHPTPEAEAGKADWIDSGWTRKVGIYAPASCLRTGGFKPSSHYVVSYSAEVRIFHVIVLRPNIVPTRIPPGPTFLSLPVRKQECRKLSNVTLVSLPPYVHGTAWCIVWVGVLISGSEWHSWYGGA